MTKYMNLNESKELLSHLRNPYEKTALEFIINFYEKKDVDISQFRAITRTMDNKRFKTEMKIRKNPQIPEIDMNYLTYKLIIRKSIVCTLKHIIRNNSLFKN